MPQKHSDCSRQQKQVRYEDGCYVLKTAILYAILPLFVSIGHFPPHLAEAAERRRSTKSASCLRKKGTNIIIVSDV